MSDFCNDSQEYHDLAQACGYVYDEHHGRPYWDSPTGERFWGDPPNRVVKDAVKTIATLQADLTALRERVKGLEKDKANMEVALALWSAVFQKYESWFANNAPAKRWPSAVLADYKRCDEASNKLTEGIKARALAALAATEEKP